MKRDHAALNVGQSGSQVGGDSEASNWHEMPPCRGELATREGSGFLSHSSAESEPVTVADAVCILKSVKLAKPYEQTRPGK